MGRANLTRHRPQTAEDLRAAIFSDFERAAATLYYLEARDGSGLQLTHLWPDQLLLTRSLQQQRNRHQPPRALVVKTRRAGTSSASAEWTFHNFYWRARQKALLVAHHDSTTTVLYDLYRTLYEELPPELQLPLHKLNRKELSTLAPHGSSLVAQTAGYLDIGRGPTIQHAHLSEIDFWPDPEVALDGILNAVHLGVDTSIIIESTANGADGWLHHFWRETRRGKTMFAPIFMPWFRVPEHRLPVPRDFAPTAEEREWIVAYGLTAEQICWYRAKMMETVAKEPWGGERKMRQEHPFTDEEAFQSSGFCIFPDVVLHRLKGGCEPPSIVRRLEHMPQAGEIREVEADFDPRLPQLTIWKGPEDGRFYSLGVDISDGVGQAESVVSICAYPGYEQVAEWASARSSVEETTYVARYLAERYGGANCLLIPEVNRNGTLILYLLFNLPGNFGIFRWRYLDRPGMEINDNPKLGWECPHALAKILTSDLRWVTAQDVQVGDELLGCAETVSGRRTLPLGRQVVTARREFTAPLVEVVLENGIRTKVSATHPFWSDRDCDPRWAWRPAASLRPGHRLKCLEPWETLTSHDAGWLAGIVDGEGHLSAGKLGGLRMATAQTEGFLADEIFQAWQRFGFGSLYKTVRHRNRPWEKPLVVCGPNRTAGTLRALGALRPKRLLRKFLEEGLWERLTVHALPTVRITEVLHLGDGPVIGLTTEPDHTLIADGIVGHNTNDNTKKALGQVANMIFLRGQGIIRSEALHEQMQRCIDILPGKRWRAAGGKSDRVIAWLVAMIGAYLDFEGGSVGGMVSERRQNISPQEIPGWREPSTYDAGVDAIYSGRTLPMGSGFEREDLEDR